MKPLHKIETAKKEIEETLLDSKKPAVLCSFGKDSLVALHLARVVCPNIDVIYHQLPFSAEKRAYARQVISQWHLRVIDLPPQEIATVTGNGRVDIVAKYSVGSSEPNQSYMVSFANLVEIPDSETTLCGARDLLMRPTANDNLPHDLLICGRKSADFDPTVGRLGKIENRDFDLGGARLTFPLRDWTDQEVWSYIEHHDLPIDISRYEKSGGKWHERSDKTFNSDYLNCCTRCLNPQQPETVFCPVKQKNIQNAASSIPKFRVKVKNGRRIVEYYLL